jgi:hypothetical protein
MLGFWEKLRRRGSHRRGVAVGLLAGFGAVAMAMAASASAQSPTVTKVTPNSGPVAGGTTVKIAGSSFTGATAVNFGSTNATSFTVTSATSITAVSPAEPPGAVDVTVTTPMGTTAISLKDRFKFTPTIANLNPSAGPISGGTNVSVTGAGFGVGTTATKLRFGKVLGTAVNCGSTTTCTVVAPAHEAGTVAVTATVNKVSGIRTVYPNAAADQFIYTPAEVKTWDLTRTVAEHPEENPLPDQLANPDVWSWMYGQADTPSSYVSMEHFIPSAVNARECSTKGFYEWNKGPTFFTLPAVIYNSGPTFERGRLPRCAASAEYPTKTFFMHPENGSSLAAVVRWKSPITGMVTVSGSVQPTDSNVEGIVWQLDQGSTIVLGPAEKADDSLTSFGPTTVSVNAGESLYFDVGPGAGGSFDTTAVNLDITR